MLTVTVKGDGTNLYVSQANSSKLRLDAKTSV